MQHNNPIRDYADEIRNGDSGQLPRATLKPAKNRRIWDAMILVVLWTVCFVVFVRAQPDFSFDYVHYIRYFDELAKLNFTNLINVVRLSLPSPYVEITSGELIVETGFAALAWVMVKLTASPAVTYALIGSTSVVMRTLLARRLGVGWGALLLLDVYTITLFEANAIRLGCSVTLLLFAIRMASLSKRLPVVAGIAGVAALFHIQSLYFSVFFFPLYYGYRLYGLRGARVIAMSAILVALALVSNKFLSLVAPLKLSEYSGREASAGGVNLVSALSCLTILIVLLAGVVMKRSHYRNLAAEPAQKMWIALTLASVPSLVLLVFETQMGALGGRLWQLSFVLLVSVGLGLPRAANAFVLTRVIRAALFGLLLVSVINVIYRYPLSNFFYPLAPYAWV